MTKFIIVALIAFAIGARFGRWDALNGQEAGERWGKWVRAYFVLGKDKL